MTQSMSDDLVELVADDLGRQIKIITPEEENTFSFYDDPADLKPRAPVVTVMGTSTTARRASSMPSVTPASLPARRAALPRPSALRRS